MTDKEVRRLRKKTLIEMLLNLTQENETLVEEIGGLRKQLKDKEIHLENAGTIAEAAFEMNGVLRAAQNAAQQYLDNLKALSERKERSFQAECEALEAATRARCEQMEKETEERCRLRVQETEREIEARWDELAGRLEEFYQSHRGLKDLLTAEAGIRRN